MKNFCVLLCLLGLGFSCQKPASPKVSVICPTYNCPERHESLYKAFANQTYEDKELLVLDDSLHPSPFFTHLKDPRVKYHTLAKPAPIGFKRNALIQMASGEIIVHFDDDSYYAPQYIATMVKKLGNADLVKLSRWLAWRESDHSLWEWDTRFAGLLHYVVGGNDKTLSTLDLKETARTDPSFPLDEWINSHLWGHSFSYVYRKSLWKDCSFTDKESQFIYAARDAGKTLLHVPDLSHLAIRILHPKSTTLIFPQYSHDSSTLSELLTQKP